ncbi:MAG: DUF4185 domain-containing protein, partial [Mycobacterium sp.]
MSAIPRVVSVSVASAAAIGLIGAIGLAPPANALPCTAPEANVEPPAASPAMPSPGPVVRPPTGRRPRGANEKAPLPKLGPLINALLHPGSRYSTPAQQQAAVIPPGPNPPGGGNQQPPNATQLSPNAAPGQPPPAAAPPAAIGGAPTSLVEWVTGPNSPNKTLERFGISGTDLGIPWDNGDPANRQALMAFGDTFGYCRVHGQQWRYNTMFRSQDRNLSDGIIVPPGVPSDKYSGSPVLPSGISKPILPGVK